MYFELMRLEWRLIELELTYFLIYRYSLNTLISYGELLNERIDLCLILLCRVFYYLVE